MAYKKVNFMDVYDVIRRWHDNQNVTHISEATSLSRKTVRKYIAIAEKLGISREDALPTKDKIVKKLEPFLNNTNKKPAPVQSVLTEYLDEIDKLVNDSENPLGPKMVFEVICEKHILPKPFLIKHVDNTNQCAFLNFINFLKRLSKLIWKIRQRNY
jgi:hypothetical protein